MIECNSDWVNDLFAATARDWTPAPVRRAIRVVFVPVSADPEATMRCASVLSPGERERAERLIAEHARTQFIQRRAFRRYCGAAALGSPQALSQVAFAETEKGRPYLPDLPEVSFSFSACRLGFLAAWSSTHRIGVDIEDPTRAVEAAELAGHYFSDREAKAVGRARGQASRRIFLQLWSLKEAALKSIGEGLPFGLDAFRFELGPQPRVVGTPGGHGRPERFGAYLMGGKGDCAALITRSAA